MKSGGQTDIQSRQYAAYIQVGPAHTAQLVNDITQASNKLAIAAETVNFSVGAAGTSGVVGLDKAPVYDSTGTLLGSFGDTSFAWVTGTILTTEVALDLTKYPTDTLFLASLSNGQFAIDYALGKLYYKKATAGTSDTCNYTTRQLNVEVTAAGVGADVNVKQVGGTTIVAEHSSAGATPKAVPVAGFYRLAADTYHDGDIVLPHFTVNGKLMVDASMAATDYADDSAFTVEADKVSATGFLADEAATDSVDEGDIGIARMTLDRKQYTAPTQLHDEIVTAHASMGAAEAKVIDGTVFPSDVAEGDVTRIAASKYGVQYVNPVAPDGLNSPINTFSEAFTDPVQGLMMAGVEAKTFDGAALPATVSEGDAQRIASTEAGVVFTMPVNADGSKSPLKEEDSAHTSGDVGYVMLAVQKTANAALADDGDYAVPQLSQDGYLKVTMNAIRDAAVSVNADVMDAGTQRVCLSTDETHFGLVGSASDSDGALHAQLRYIADAIDTLEAREFYKVVATGAGALAFTSAAGHIWELNSITVHFDVAPTTSENLDIQIDSTDGSDYDTVLFKVDPSAAALTDFTFIPSHPILLAAGDEIVVGFPNTDTRTWGVRIVGTKLA